MPMWVLCFSVLLGLQRFSLSLGAVVLLIVIGIALASVDDTEAEEAEELQGAVTHVVGAARGLEVLAEHAQRLVRRLATEPWPSSHGASPPAVPPRAPPGVSLLGFTLLLVASLCSGLRWALTQLLLKRPPGLTTTLPLPYPNPNPSADASPPAQAALRS